MCTHTCWGKRICICASGIFARAARPTDERRRTIAKLKFSSESDTTNTLLKTRKGVVRWADAEGPYMRGKESTLPLLPDIAVGKAYSCEAETELGEGCLPSPNQRRCPRYRRARWAERGIAAHIGI